MRKGWGWNEDEAGGVSLSSKECRGLWRICNHHFFFFFNKLGVITYNRINISMI